MSSDVPSEPHPTDGLPRAGEVIAGRYAIEGILGAGGMGTVLGATDLVTQAPVAVKWVLPGRGGALSRERLLREARLSRQITHPNVVRVHDVGEDRGSVFLVMELLRGAELEEWVMAGPHPAELAIGVLMPVLRAVSAAHAAGIVHRDLKPQNILLCGTPEGAVRPMVIDFGISRGAHDAVLGDMTLTRQGIAVGTPLYMAPEQLAATAEPDPRSDIYALGVMLYELLAAAPPFEAPTHGLLIAEKLSHPALPLTETVFGFDPALDRVVMRALERAPERRYPSVEAFARALEPFATARFDSNDPSYRGASPTTLPAPTPAVPRTRRRSRDRRARLRLALGGVAALLAAMAFGAWWASSPPEPAPSSTIVVTSLPPEPTAPAPAHGPDPTPGPTTAGTITTDTITPASSTATPRRPHARGRTGRLRVDDF